MKNYKKIIALNGGKNTEEALTQKSEKPVFAPKTKDMSLEITNGSVQVYLEDKIFDCTNAVIFNRYPTDSHFCGILLEYLNTKNCLLLNKASLSYKRSTEKTAQMSRMATQGINVPHTFVVHIKTYEKILPVVESALQYPFVAKVDGIRGEKVACIDNKESLDAFMDGFDENELCLFQEFIPNEGDIRIIYALGEYQGAIKRRAKENAFLNNYAQGGSVEDYEATSEEIELAQKACQVNEFDIAGVDIMHSPNGPYVIEVNMGPGLTGFESVHGTGKVFSSVVKKLEN